MPSTVNSIPASKSKPTAIPATAMPLISPNALLLAHLQQTPPTRPSSRSPNQAQQIDLNTGSLTHTNGSSVVKIGSTTIVCGIRAEILPISEIPSYDPKTTATTSTSIQSSDTKPISPETPTPLSLYNLLVPNLELSTGCSPLLPANTPPSIQAQSLSQRIYSLLLTSHIIQPSDLQITYTPPVEVDADLNPDDPAYIPRDTEVKAFWVLYIDMMCISYGGEASVFDAAWLSLYAALRDTILPRAWWDADEGTVLCDAVVSNGRKLDVRGCPVPLGFGVVSTQNGNSGKDTEQRDWVIMDPDSFEEQCCDEVGCVTVDLSTEEKVTILRVEKSGGGVVGIKELKEILIVAGERWREWQTVLQRVEGARGKIG